jgi:hypothetical protein
MTKEEHKKRHIELHEALDELFADFIQHHLGESSFTNKPISELLTWAYEQTINPTEL